ncbi:MAG TPA: ECF transporter S component [Candidatus Ventrousia excrementavium]|uniref:ECF transporter S component n=1 Tax=Candidatus Ventrousia excrementavium TaxID=2840961 RepID=A0A9D1IV43_9CLOT|nr:ECF transporter S component [Candidatus Ventrousia excrementavium]
MHKTDTRKLTQLALLIAIQLILSFTPLGFIILPGMVSITIMHIPVIVGGIVMGPMYGGILGLVFGLLSMYKATTAATSVVDQAFSPFLSGAPVQSIIMCIIPRVLLGVVAALLFRALEKRIKSKGLAIAISAAVASVMHTVLVLGCLWALFDSLPLKSVFLTLVTLNGFSEIAVAVIVAVGVCRPLLRLTNKT